MVNGVASSSATILRMLVGTSSGPEALCGLRPQRSLWTPFTSICIGGMRGDGLPSMGGKGSEVMFENTEANCSFKIVALAFGSL